MGKALSTEKETAVPLDVLVPPVVDDATAFALDRANSPRLTQHATIHLPLVGREHDARSAVALARQAGDREQLALALIILDHVYLTDGQLEECEACALEATELLTLLDHRPKLQDVWHGLALIRLGTGNFDAGAR